jgi:hypothetical protein
MEGNTGRRVVHVLAGNFLKTASNLRPSGRLGVWTGARELQIKPTVTKYTQKSTNDHAERHLHRAGLILGLCWAGVQKDGTPRYIARFPSTHSAKLVVLAGLKMFLISHVSATI